MANNGAVSFDEEFWPSVHRLDPAHSHRVIQSLNQFADNPDHPNLHLKSLHGDLKGLMSVRAGREVRVLLERRGETFVWLEAGMRKNVYDRAARGRFIVNPGRRFMGFVDPETPSDQRRRPLPTGNSVADDLRGVFDHWTDAELTAAGFSEDEVTTLRSCTDEYELLALEWPNDRLDLVLTAVEQTPEQWDRGDGDDHESRLRQAIEQFGGLTGISPLFSPEELDRIAKAPIEDWMVFLHPDQRSLVDRAFTGPARVRGAAGTGKTVVALHRAAHLAAEATPAAPVLFTTVMSSLPPILDQLYRRMPDAQPERVAFRSVTEVATAVLTASGEKVAADLVEARDAFDSALQAKDAETPIAVAADYLYDEVVRVIAGRAVASRDEYRAAGRPGRRLGLGASARDHVWTVYEAWVAELDRRGVTHPVLVAQRALELVRNGAAFPDHTAVVVDEAQDLTMVELLLLRAVANGGGRRDRPNGLLLVGDGAQRVQAGGYTLRSAGVEVRGRTSVLRVNYRNTAEILEAALAVAGDEAVIDLDEELRRGEAAPTPIRRGPRPRLVELTDDEAEYDELAKLVSDLGGSALISSGDIGIFVPPEQLELTTAEIERRGVPLLAVSDYLGTTTDEVKIGSHAEAKGLEFKAVLLPRLGADTFPEPAPSGESADERGEREALELSRLFVAMTRARDVLVVTSAGPVADVLSRARGAFDET